ncbi:MAG: endonuclease III [Candidatus Hydrogenedens sp.]
MVQNEVIKRNKEKAKKIYDKLLQLYPDAHCTLNYHSPFELLIMTILASQCTDERVNKVCMSLFQKLKSPHDFINLGQKQLENRIRPVGFYKNKAQHIINTCKLLIEKYDGKVPNTMNDLLKLQGVGRKTANVILGECFNTPGIIVDTHCGRLTRRLGLTSSDNPQKIEQDLMQILPEKKWTLFSHLLVFHGRNICLARNPKCNFCIINKHCNFYKKLNKDNK